MQASSINEHRTPPELLQLDGVQSQHFRAGQTIHEPEDPANLFYLIESGEVRLYDVASGGTARLLEILGPDEWVGTAVLGQMPVYARRAVAVTDAVLWAIPALSLRKMLAEHGEVALQIIESMVQRLQAAWSEGSQLVFDDCRLRLIKTLVRFSNSPAAKRSADGVVLRITHKQLAQAVGAARETISVCLTELRLKNLIRTGRNQLIFDPEQLQALDPNGNAMIRMAC
ncbi:MAG: Crp/Fnr family transcriptional regulator [Tepidisphaeraceae bacterium]|jgi:CRP-like cAMP-binding protein